MKTKGKGRHFAFANAPVAPIRYLTEISSHVKAHFGSDIFVLHEKKSNLVHVDVHVAMPNTSRPYFTLMTSGMSDLPMTTPSGLEGLAFAEVCLCLPMEWPIRRKHMRWAEPEYFWPIAVLKDAAKYPHRQKTWFSWGHTVGSLEYPEPLDPSGRFVGLYLAPPATLPQGAEKITIESGPEINLLAVIPLTYKEFAFARAHSGDLLDEKLIEANITELLDPLRKSVV